MKILATVLMVLMTATGQAAASSKEPAPKTASTNTVAVANDEAVSKDARQKGRDLGLERLMKENGFDYFYSEEANGYILAFHVEDARIQRVMILARPADLGDLKIREFISLVYSGPLSQEIVDECLQTTFTFGHLKIKGDTVLLSASQPTRMTADGLRDIIGTILNIAAEYEKRWSGKDEF